MILPFGVYFYFIDLRMNHTRESLIESFKTISTTGWISNYRSTSSGNAGNILEDLLGIEENNLPLPDAGEYEIKCQRVKCTPTSLLTLFHSEPEPRDMKVVPYYVQHFGWEPTVWKSNYSETEKSFRQTINGLSFSDRGFRVVVDRPASRINVVFDRSKVSTKNKSWMESICPSLDIMPYWTFSDLNEKIHAKLKNMFYVIALTKTEEFGEIYKYGDVTELREINVDRFLEQIERGNVYIDFNARSGHNHGTSFRIRQSNLPNLYDKVQCVV